MDSARALAAKARGIALVSRTMGVSRAQLSLRMNRSADWLDRRGNRRNNEADAGILSAILNIISDMPSYGYRRVWGILRKQRRSEGQPPVNAKLSASSTNEVSIDDDTRQPTITPANTSIMNAT
ncbi:IS2 transposase TnpB [Yokenella regensburgei]|uniref:IS2 transposase TnpB n=1 Tax=Yokenella regensburgei TaxID=158877 RepID=A0AB38FUF3_9ENTR|nr:IS2 transposase TnpB [Yokenella regensburgei]SQB02205.1 IS2 transposase TnpB [Yokenella regensburgei]SUQ07494.1 IS2 transposase TnpB [Yokenella regensburgei]